MLTLADAFSKLKPIKVLVIGDFLLDVYTKGKVDRISPEAPVPVLLVTEIIKSPGGAGNVSLNLKALGAEVSVIGRIGNDDSDLNLHNLLKVNEIDVNGLFFQDGYRTPLKNRFLADGQQLMRTDYEVLTPLSQSIEKVISNYIKNELPKYDIVAVSDYGKGFLSRNLLKTILDEGRKHSIRIIIDPKGKDFTKYNGAFLIKPNNKEAYAAAGYENDVTIEKVVEKIFEKVDAENLIITRSDKGMSLFTKNYQGVQNFPAVKKDVIDVTGAGDTALAMIAFAIANGLSFSHAIELANIASGLAIEKLGCAAIRLADIAGRLLERDLVCKIIWEDTNLFFIKQAIEYEDINILDLRGYEDISTEVYRYIKEAVSKKNDSKLIIHAIPTETNINFIQLLASMHGVDFVFARCDDPRSLLARSVC